jgi:hypothetical protein
MAVPAMDETMGASYPDDEGPEACPQNRSSVSMMIARSIIDGVGGAANLARRHLHRGQFRILDLFHRVPVAVPACAFWIKIPQRYAISVKEEADAGSSVTPLVSI